MDCEKIRLSVDFNQQDHRLLKLECCKKGLVPKKVIENLVLNWLEDVQDKRLNSLLEKINQEDRWNSFELLKRRMGWDAIQRRNQRIV